jgi:hypothetical protein
MYRRCIEEDPLFAPAWARLGRIYRLIAKYGHGDPETNYGLAAQAISKALEINPDLPIAQIPRIFSSRTVARSTPSSG